MAGPAHYRPRQYFPQRPVPAKGWINEWMVTAWVNVFRTLMHFCQLSPSFFIFLFSLHYCPAIARRRPNFHITKQASCYTGSVNSLPQSRKVSLLVAAFMTAGLINPSMIASMMMAIIFLQAEEGGMQWSAGQGRASQRSSGHCSRHGGPCQPQGWCRLFQVGHAAWAGWISRCL